MAYLPWRATLEEFDVAFPPSVSATRIRELGELTFRRTATNISLIGPPGVGENPSGHRLGDQGVSCS
ncbi:MAG TPA: ATP-binding protein [Chloroflexota bacterium]|nr:ATP-binding protein [Chloroflexota bacterium]